MTGWEYDPEGFEFKLNADLILKKPFEMEELDLALEKLLSKMHTKKIRSRATPKKTQVITPDTIRQITKWCTLVIYLMHSKIHLIFPNSKRYT